jgi:hypothetical protein
MRFLTLVVSVIVVGAAIGDEERSRPVERPSRTAESILKDQEEKKRRAAEEAEKQKREAEGERETEDSKNAGADSPAKNTGTPTVFTIPGAEAWAVASRLGWKFFPRGASGPRDGNRSVAQLHPNLDSSLVVGPVMTQMRTPPGWNVFSENVFFMFADARGQPRQFAPGWRMRDVRVVGTNWRWAVPSRHGATTPFFAVRITGLKATIDSVVELKSITIEGPPGAQDWRDAFVVR